MQIGILQTGHAPDELRPTLGDYSDMFERLLGPHGFTFRTWNVVDMDFPDGPGDADAWLITGSRHGAYEDHPFIPPLEALIRDIHAANLPMVGICFGHQIIAQAMGGRVVKFRGGWIVGSQDYDWDGASVTLNAWHQDQVVERPRGAAVVASSPTCENAALLYGDRIFTVQAHPEFGAPVIQGLIEHRSASVPDELRDRARENLDRRVDNARVGATIARFLTERRLS